MVNVKKMRIMYNEFFVVTFSDSPNSLVVADLHVCHTSTNQETKCDVHGTTCSSIKITFQYNVISSQLRKYTEASKVKEGD